MFIAFNSKYFSGEKLPFIRAQLENLDDSKFMIIQALDYKDPNTMLLISIFGGHLGIDRFMLGQTGLGVLKLLTCGGIFIWTIVDWFLIMDISRDHNFDKLMRHIY